ncbi:MAG: hypothetical protein EA397_18165 [Deltaproteobacteria bacterium]|nr:MAG: hypothetical protein EA397_18165 [Deltaproteobacteria bacterium]
MRPALLSLLIACSGSPTLTAVEPDQALPGAELQIFGERLAAPVLVRVERPSPGEAQAIELPVEGVAPDAIQVKLPEQIEPGTYDVVVTTGRYALRAPAAFRVLQPLSDVPCGELYRANTRVSSVAGEVTIDKFFRDGERETVKVRLDEIVGVELANVPGPKGGRCSVITLVRSDGDRLRFADDPKVDLHDRAHKLAQEIGRPITTLTEPVADTE